MACWNDLLVIALVGAVRKRALPKDSKNSFLRYTLQTDDRQISAAT